MAELPKAVAAAKAAKEAQKPEGSTADDIDTSNITPAQKPEGSTASEVIESAGEELVDENIGRDSGAKVRVKNIHDRTLFLANGAIEKGGVGIATVAELQNLHQYLEEAI